MRVHKLSSCNRHYWQTLLDGMMDDKYCSWERLFWMYSIVVLIASLTLCIMFYLLHGWHGLLALGWPLLAFCVVIWCILLRLSAFLATRVQCPSERNTKTKKMLTASESINLTHQTTELSTTNRGDKEGTSFIAGASRINTLSNSSHMCFVLEGMPGALTNPFAKVKPT